jgi:hypothetical protein
MYIVSKGKWQMPFIKIEGFTGNIYVPEINNGKKKHHCKDCFSCQFCSDERCELCLGKKFSAKKHPPGKDPVTDK